MSHARLEVRMESLAPFLQGTSTPYNMPVYPAHSIGDNALCAGINRHVVGNARILGERSSEPLGPEFCVAHREVFGEA